MEGEVEKQKRYLVISLFRYYVIRVSHRGLVVRFFIHSFFDSLDHSLAFPSTEHGKHPSSLDIEPSHSNGCAIGFLGGKLTG